MSSLGKKLEELRKNAGITQEELAQELKVSRQTVSLWEQDLVAPKSDALKSLCEFFNVKPEYLLFVAWLKAPTEGATVSVSSSSWNFDIVTILQILAGVLIFVAVCILTVLLVKYIKNRKK